MRWILLMAAFWIFLVGCAVYELPQNVMMTFNSGKTMEVKAIERVGLFGQDWFVGGAELCDPALEGKCITQIFHGHGGSLANHAAYGVGGAAILAPAIRDSGTEVNQNNDNDQSQSQGQRQGQRQHQHQQQSVPMPMPMGGGGGD